MNVKAKVNHMENNIEKILRGGGGGAHAEWVQNNEIDNYSAYHVPLYRYYNPWLHDHHYTINWNELGYGKYGYVFEKIEGYLQSIPGAGALPVYRYCNPEKHDHFITIDYTELGAGRDGYVLEGIIGYAFDKEFKETKQFYRYWNPSPDIQDHMWSSDFFELQSGKFGYLIEGVFLYL